RKRRAREARRMRFHGNIKRRRIIAAAALAAAAGCFCQIAPGAAVSWTSSSSGSWTDAVNWSSNPSLPGARDDVTVDQAVPGLTVTLGAGNQSINILTNQEAILLNGASASLSVAGEIVGSTTAGTFTQTAGTHSASGSLFLGFATGTSGT